MKKLKLVSVIIFTFFQITQCNSQRKQHKLEYQNDNLINEIGIGLVQQLKVNEKVILYEDYKLTKQKKVDDTKLGIGIIPLLYKVDYNILFFVCVEKNVNSYKIVTTKGKYAYIKKSDTYLFYEWNDFIKNQITSVEIKNPKANPLFDTMNGNPIYLKNMQPDDEIEIMEIKDNWLKVKNSTINKSYWIKWRQDNDLLIYLNLLM